jgi:hypothetical protein
MQDRGHNKYLHVVGVVGGDTDPLHVRFTRQVFGERVCVEPLHVRHTEQIADTTQQRRQTLVSAYFAREGVEKARLTKTPNKKKKAESNQLQKEKT